MTDRYRIPFAITKIDEDTRTVEGVATVEALDQQGEIVDFDTAKTVLPGTWPGNVREMHAPIAVGTGAVVEIDEAAKAIKVRAIVSKGAPLTWEKVKDGTLKGFSIGGSSAKRVKEVVKATGQAATRLFLRTVDEISLVDNPACPGTGFAIVKMVGDAMTPQPDDTPIAVEPAPAAEPVEKRERTQAELDKVKHFAGPDQSYPIEDAQDVKNAVTALGRAKGGAPARAKIKAKIISIAKDLKLEDALPDSWKITTPAFTKAVTAIAAEPWDVSRAAGIVASINELIATEAYEALMEGDDADLSQVALLKAAGEAMVAFLQSEFAEQFEDDGAADDAGDSMDDAAKISNRVELAKRVLTIAESDAAKGKRLGALVAKVIGLLDVTKAGAEFSAKNKQKIQAIHDHAASMGADCGKDAEKVAPAGVDVQKAIDTATGDVRKALDTATAKVTELEGSLTAKAALIEQLDARLKTIEAQPAAGGPVKTAPVEKAAAGQVPGAESDQLTPDVMARAFRKIADESTDPAVRQGAAEQLTRFSLANPVRLGGR